MINRYQGNSGRMVRFPEPGEQPSGAPSKQPGRPSPPFPPGLDALGRLLPERFGELETEDLILLLILYLMYRESGDSELLIIMGAMFLL